MEFLIWILIIVLTSIFLVVQKQLKIWETWCDMNFPFMSDKQVRQECEKAMSFYYEHNSTAGHKE